MRITFDPAKRSATLEARKLDFADAVEMFAGAVLSRRDDRQEYGEERFVSVGRVRGVVVVLVWTPRAGGKRIISMRKANAREKVLYEKMARP